MIPWVFVARGFFYRSGLLALSLTLLLSQPDLGPATVEVLLGVKSECPSPRWTAFQGSRAPSARARVILDWRPSLASEPLLLVLPRGDQAGREQSANDPSKTAISRGVGCHSQPSCAQPRSFPPKLSSVSIISEKLLFNCLTWRCIEDDSNFE